jgi:catechol 2,3-dioxygenase-like lactoylglutathione lyase family enzyme
MNALTFKAIPTFRILDYEKAKAFYVEFLGFNVDWEHRFGKNAPVYMQVSKNSLILHLSENERFQTGMIVFVETTGLEKFHDELSEKSDGILVPDISITGWNTRQMEIEDPFGNLLRFNENYTQSTL